MAAAATGERGLRVLARLQLANGGHLVAAGGTVLDFRGDAIVNAANEGCVGGGGVDGAINDAAGPALVEARKKLGGCPTGQAKSTPSFRLKPHVQLIVHAVGPAYRAPFRGSVEVKDALLASAYLCALQEAVRGGASSVAFALISAGVFRGPRSLQDVLRIGFRTLLAAMEGDVACGGAASDRASAAGGAGSVGPAAAKEVSGSTKGPLEVFLVAYTSNEQEALKQVFAEANSKSASSAADAPVCAAASGGSVGTMSTSMGRSAAAPVKLLPCSRKFSEATEAIATTPLAISYAGGVVDIPAGARYYTDAAGVALIGWCGSYDPPGDMDGESVLARRY
jgi:O-acetyl-ADP-ribose deacetylase (regulator of RNase III)